MEHIHNTHECTSCAAGIRSKANGVLRCHICGGQAKPLISIHVGRPVVGSKTARKLRRASRGYQRSRNSLLDQVAALEAALVRAGASANEVLPIKNTLHALSARLDERHATKLTKLRSMARG